MGSEFKQIDIDVLTKAVGSEKAPEAPDTGASDREHIRTWANIPLRFKDAQLKAITPQQEAVIAKIRANVSGKRFMEVRDMIIVGGVGTGKTSTVVGLLNALIDNNIYCRYSTEYELLDMYFRKENVKFDGFKNTKVLVIDEIAKRPLVDWQMIQLEELLSHRYNMMLPTILVSNKTIEEIRTFLGTRVVDRLRDNKVMVLTLDGDSLRGKQND